MKAHFLDRCSVTPGRLKACARYGAAVKNTGCRRGSVHRIRASPSELYINIFLFISMKNKSISNRCNSASGRTWREIRFFFFYEREAETKRPVKVGGNWKSLSWLTHRFGWGQQNKQTPPTTPAAPPIPPISLPPTPPPPRRLPPNMERLNRSLLGGGVGAAARTRSWTWRTASPAADGRWEERWEGEGALVLQGGRGGGTSCWRLRLCEGQRYIERSNQNTKQKKMMKQFSFIRVSV